MLASMKRQFVELLSDIGFAKEGLTVRALERLTRDGGDGVIEASGYEVRLFICNNLYSDWRNILILPYKSYFG